MSATGRGLTHAILWVIAMTAVGCGDGPTHPVFSQPDVRPWVAGAAAQAIDANGHFVFPVAQINSPYAAIDEARASALASAFVSTFSRDASFAGMIKLQRAGNETIFANVGAAPRVEFAASPYQPVTDDVPATSRRSYGPLFIVRMMEGNAPAITISVSVHATELTIENGLLVFPSQSGGEFGWLGTPPAAGEQNPISAEVATEAIARVTGAKIVAVPELLAPHRDYAFSFSRWRIRLDRDVTLKVNATGRDVITREVYVGLELNPRQPTAFFVPAPVQPQKDTVPKSPPIILDVRAQIPIVFEQVRVIP